MSHSSAQAPSGAHAAPALASQVSAGHADGALESAPANRDEVASLVAPGGLSGGLPPNLIARRLWKLQGTLGNQAVQRLIWLSNRTGPGLSRASTAASSSPIQRHPAGTELPTRDQQVSEIAEAESRVVAPAAEGGGTGAPGSTSTAPTAGSSATTTSTAPENVPPSTEGPRARSRGSATAPARPVTSRALSLARAQQILQAAYGSVHTIVPGNIQMLPDRAAMWTRYDELCIAGNIHNRRTGQTWRSGDAQAAFPGGLNGFAWHGTVYVNQASAIETTTPHEMLHLNTASGFRAAVGETFNEGATQYLTLKALRAAGTRLRTYPYREEVELTERLVALVGENTLTTAYFNGPNTLIQAYERLKGAGSFARLKAAADARRFADAGRLLTR